MAVSSATSWTNTTAVVALAGATRVKSVRITLNPAATAETYVQLYDAAATPGTTAPNLVLPVPVPYSSGPRTVSYPLPGGGYRCGTELDWFVSTTHDGGTAATTNAPLQVDVHHAPGN